jgi:hypothetical protein
MQIGTSTASWGIWFPSSEKEWVRRTAKESDAVEFKEKLLKKYFPDMKYERQDVINLADRFEVEIKPLRPYMGVKDLMKVYRDFITPYLYYHNLKLSKGEVKRQSPRLAWILNQRMCIMFNIPKEAWTWIEDMEDLQHSARILQRFLDCGLKEGMKDKFPAKSDARPSPWTKNPALKLGGISDHPVPKMGPTQKSLSFVFFRWDRMAKIHDRLVCDVIGDIYIHINDLEHSGWIPYAHEERMEPFEKYDLMELEEIIKEVYATAIALASGRYIPMSPYKLMRWFGNAKILQEFGYPPERLTELLHKLISRWHDLDEKKEKARGFLMKAHDLRVSGANTKHAHPLLKELKGRMVKIPLSEEEEKEKEKAKKRRGVRRGPELREPEYSPEEWEVDQTERE